MAAYLEHMAIKVADIEWHIQFFQDVFEMPVRMSLGEAPHRKVWLHAGIQLNEEVDFKNVEGRGDHMGIMVENVEATLEKAYQLGVKELPQGHNWIQLKSGLCIEVIQGKKEVLQNILTQEPWLD